METAVLSHPDEVSGTTILEDGTKLHWTEGRSSQVHAVYADGTQEVFDASGQPHPMLDALSKIDEEGAEIYRGMTEDEAREHGQARGWPEDRWSGPNPFHTA